MINMDMIGRIREGKVLPRAPATGLDARKDRPTIKPAAPIHRELVVETGYG